MTGEVEDYSQLVQAIELVPPNSPVLPSLLTNLADSIFSEYYRTERPEDLDRAVAYLRRALDGTPENSPYRLRIQWQLGYCLGARFKRAKNEADLEEGITTFEQILAYPGFGRADEDFREHVLVGAAHVIRMRWELKRASADLDRMVELSRQAVEGLSPDSPDRPWLLNSLCADLGDRHGATHRLEDLEETIAAYRELIAAYPRTGRRDRPGLRQLPDLPHLSIHVSSLSGALSHRYRRTGRREDLDEAITVLREAAHAVPPGSLELRICLDGLGMVFSDRFAPATGGWTTSAKPTNAGATKRS